MVIKIIVSLRYFVCMVKIVSCMVKIIICMVKLHTVKNSTVCCYMKILIKIIFIKRIMKYYKIKYAYNLLYVLLV